MLFFGELSDILRIYPHYHLDYRYYDGGNNEKWAKRISSDDFLFSGNVYDFYRLVREDIPLRLPNPFYREGATNVNGRDILSSVLEGLANMLANADYSLPGGASLTVKPTSVCFLNAGRMGVSLTQALSGGLSKPYNESVMTFFRNIDVVEKAGSGIPKIVVVSKRYGYLPPRVKEDPENMVTELTIPFIPLSKDTPSYSLKERIIATLSKHPEGMSTYEIALELSMSKAQIVTVCREMIVERILKDNGKPRKGRKLYLSE